MRRREWRQTLAAAACLAAVTAGCREAPEAYDLPPRAIQWERAAPSLGGERRVISGVVTSIDETRLAFEVSGVVQSVEVDLGAAVEAGDVLARLDPEPLELAVRDAEAALAEVNALLELAATTLARFEDAGSAVARQELDQARTTRDARQSQVGAARARLTLARRDLRRSELRAPFRGSVSSRRVDPAQRVAAGETVFELDSDEGGLRVEVQMPETLIDRVRPGDAVEVRFASVGAGDDEGASFPAVVAEVGTRAGTGNAFPVRADLRYVPTTVRPGMTATATFRLPRGDAVLDEDAALVVPLGAVLPETRDRFAVFVFDPETSTVTKRSVEPGGVGDDSLAILAGLEEGEIIATAGVSFLRDGQTVTLLGDELVRDAP